MDPPMFLPFSPPNGLPQESKLVTYMNHSPQVQQISHTMENMNLHVGAVPKRVVTDCMPGIYYVQTPLIPESPEHPSPPNMPSTSSNHQIHQENVGGTTYFYPTGGENLAAQGVLNVSPNMGHYVAPIAAPSMAATTPYQARYEQMYMNNRPVGSSDSMDKMRHSMPLATPKGKTSPIPGSYYSGNQSMVSELSSRNDLYLEHSINNYSDLPEQVGNYTELIPLEPPGSIASTYRATHLLTGKHHVLRRLRSFSKSIDIHNLHLWRSLSHPNVVRLYDIFTTKEFNDHSMVFVYDYHPGSETLLSKYLAQPSANNAMGNNRNYDPFSSDPNAPRPYTHQKNAMLRAVACGALLPESVLWNILIQLTAALRAVHSAGLSCRNLSASKVLIQENRVRISFAGIADALSPSSPNFAADVNVQEDLLTLGRLALTLACRSATACHPDHILNSMKKISKMYSLDVKNFILHLMTGTRNRSINNLMPMIGGRFYNQLDSLQQRVDVVEQQLDKEMDNGRLLKLLFKLSSIVERPELNMDPEWSETGDRYMLKLFRDYIFHGASTEDGRPWLDQAHIVYCLNQLDAGTDNPVQLTSPDGQSILVVRYSELKSYLNNSFDDLTRFYHRVSPNS